MCNRFDSETSGWRAAQQKVAMDLAIGRLTASIALMRICGARLAQPAMPLKFVMGPPRLVRSLRKPRAHTLADFQSRMDSVDGRKPSRTIRTVLIRIAAALAIVVLSFPASAYVLYRSASCSPGQKWDVSRPVKVRLLASSYFDYIDKFKARGGKTGLIDLARIDRDIKAVIELYNSIPGSGLVLTLDTDAAPSGDLNLELPDKDNFGTQTIVIGFTDEVAAASSTAEAWAPGDPKDGCTRTRAHILFRKDFNWTFGPPDTTDVDGRTFSTADQPRLQDPVDPNKTVAPRTFLGILTHEMGHALGLGHPDDKYSVMAQNFRTWFRGPDGVLRTRLLPDDIAGILALYGTSEARQHLDVSVSNSWFKPAQAQFRDCTTQIARVNAAARAVGQATGLPIGRQFPAGVIVKGEHAELFAELEHAQDALRACEDSKNAVQIANCKVSSRGDIWVDPLSGAGDFCGVNNKTGSAYAPVSEKICPGAQVQLRYTLNNHSMFRDALVKSEAWFSRDTALNTQDGSDAQSPDIREFNIKAGASAQIGQMFRLPADVRDGERLYVFVRAVPYDPRTGANLWGSDADRWNNALTLRSAIRVDSGVCR